MLKKKVEKLLVDEFLKMKMFVTSMTIEGNDIPPRPELPEAPRPGEGLAPWEFAPCEIIDVVLVRFLAALNRQFSIETMEGVGIFDDIDRFLKTAHWGTCCHYIRGKYIELLQLWGQYINTNTEFKAIERVANLLYKSLKKHRCYVMRSGTDNPRPLFVPPPVPVVLHPKELSSEPDPVVEKSDEPKEIIEAQQPLPKKGECCNDWSIKVDRLIGASLILGAGYMSGYLINNCTQERRWFRVAIGGIGHQVSGLPLPSLVWANPFKVQSVSIEPEDCCYTFNKFKHSRLFFKQYGSHVFLTFQYLGRPPCKIKFWAKLPKGSLSTGIKKFEASGVYVDGESDYGNY